MSYITNLLIAFSSSEDEEKVQQQLAQYEHHHRPFSAVSVDSPALPTGWYGGSKFWAGGLLIGAYNHLNLDELLAFMRTMQWEVPEFVHLIVKEEQAFKFRVIDLFPEE
ncbi:hypothetical protein [Hymenobacter arizonensis]|uniref:YCII-related domain-containing protein n=1 Tax=Hymenobacter arizonensis TaxID=1227077 RepID=A0A1I6BNZ9_HYMAR|nr:hypothetical protein [Hymenobacter arizonensis]SFQ82646.1 hypothetical protein SAMN04515668_4855 [Hymenobacter arizonensis]